MTVDSQDIIATRVVDASARGDLAAVRVALREGGQTLSREMFRAELGRRALLAVCAAAERRPGSREIPLIVDALADAGAHPGPRKTAAALYDAAADTGNVDFFMSLARRFSRHPSDDAANLMRAVRRNNAELARRLIIGAGLPLRAPGHSLTVPCGVDMSTYGAAALAEAVRLGHAEVANLLISYGARSSADVVSACVQRNDVECLRRLKKEGRLVSQRESLIEAITKRRDAITALLLPLTSSTETLALALQFATEYGCAEACRLVIERMRQLRAPPGNLDELLISAVHLGHASTAQVLLGAGANPNYFHGEPLRRAALFGTAELVVLLIRAGADPDLVPADVFRNGRAKASELVEHLRALIPAR